jgi:osmotically-inducible protein OsmY
VARRQYDAAAAAKSTAQDMWTTSAVWCGCSPTARPPGFDIDVDTEHGVVTLFGLVDSQPLKNAAGREVHKVDGVRALVNELQVVAPASRRPWPRRRSSTTR